MTSTEKKLKINWDEKITELYIKICVQEVRNGNRPTTHLNKKGWDNLHDKLKNLANKDFDKKQLKNKWDSLKKDWQIWRKLIGKETGLGWNAMKRTVDATDEWWDAKLKEIPSATKFREKGLLFAEELEIIFGDVVATGEQAWAPSSGSLPEFLDEGNQCLEKDNLNVEGSEDSVEMIDKRKSQMSGKGIAFMGCSSSSHTIKKKQSSSNSLSKSLERISGIVESVNSKLENHNMKDCLDVIKAVGIEQNTPFYYKCLIVLTKSKDVRKMLLSLDSVELQLGYLNAIVNDNN